MRNLLFLLSLLALCACKKEVTCPDPYDPATMEFRKYIVSLDGKYRFRELYINGVDSSSILDSMRIRNQVFNTKDYDSPIFIYNQGCKIVEQFLEESSINTKEFLTGNNTFLLYSFGIATKQNEPGTLVINMNYKKYNKDSTGRRINIRYNFYRYFNSAEYKFLSNLDTLTLTRKSSGYETKLIFY